MARITKAVWVDRDNAFKLRLESSSPDSPSAPTDLTTVSSMGLELSSRAGDHSLTVDRDAADAAINWWDYEQGEVEFTLGPWAGQDGIVAGSYDCRLTIYAPATPSGIVWLSFAGQELAVDVYQTS